MTFCNPSPSPAFNVAHLHEQCRATYEYLFNEEDTPLPDLGGIETTLLKRARHRRAVVRMLYDHFQSDRLVLCVDPGSIEIIRDFCADQARLHVLDIACEYSDDYLAGHAARVGLVGENSPVESVQRILPTLRNEMAHEAELIRSASEGRYFRLAETADRAGNAAELARFLSVPVQKAETILQLDYLFTD